jgi:hypothetical protein
MSLNEDLSYLGINKYNPSTTLDVNGSALISGNLVVNGTSECDGNIRLNNSFSMSSAGTFMIDAQNVPGGRCLVDNNGLTVPNITCSGTITNSQLTTQINNISSTANSASNLAVSINSTLYALNSAQVTTQNLAQATANNLKGYLSLGGGSLTGNLIVPYLNSAAAAPGSFTGILVDNTNVNLGSGCQITLRNGPNWAAVLDQSSQGDGNYFGISLTQNGNTNIAAAYTVKNYAGTITHNFYGAVNFNTTINTNGIQINGADFLEFGAGVTKGGASGKIGYQGYSAGFLDIVGCGTGDTNRQIKLWDNVLIANILDCPNYYQNGQPWQPLMGIPTDFKNNSITSGTLTSTGGIYCNFLAVNDSSASHYYMLQDYSYNNYNSLQLFSSKINGWTHLFQSDSSSFQKNGSTTWNVWSDRRLKREIVSLDTSLSLKQVMKLKPVSFYWKNSEQHTSKINRSFLADEYQKIFPDLVYEHEADGKDKELCADTAGTCLTIQMDLIPTLVSSIQELKKQLDDVKKELDTFKKMYVTDRNDFLYINRCLSL